MTISNSYGENLVNSRLQPLTGYNTYVDNKFRLSNKSIASWSFDGDIPVEMNYILLWNKDTATFNIKPGQNMIFTEDEDNPYVRQILEVYTDPDELFTNSINSNITAPSQILIDSATGNGTQITYIADNNLKPGNIITISGMFPSGYNLSNVEVISATSTQFIVAGTETTPSTVGGVLTIVKAFNSDVYIKYLDDQYIEQIKTITVQFDADGYPRDQIYLVTEDWENRIDGSSGWIITSEGNSIFNNVAVRGEISAQSGNFEGFLTVNNGTMRIGSGVATTDNYDVLAFEILNEQVILTIGTHSLNVGDQIVVSNVDSLSAVFSLFPEPANITNAVGNGTQVTYTANNSFITGSTIAIIGTDPADFEKENATILSATTTQFTIASTVTSTYNSGGIAIVNSIPVAGTDINGAYTLSATATNTITYDLQAPDFPETLVSYGSVVAGVEKDGLYINQDNYWYSDGTISIGEADKSITYDGSDLIIGADVIINASLTAESLTVGTSPNFMVISDNANGLGDAGLYINSNNHWYSDGHFKVGGSTNYVEWEGSALIVKGTINDLELGRGGGNVATNFAVGLNALKSNTTGSNNVALGGYALSSNTVGFQNVAIGYRSLANNISAINNVALGYYALESNIVGAENIAAGYFSLQSNTSGSKNIAFGSFSLWKNTEGYENVAIGSLALGMNTTGIFNIAIGSSALQSNIDGIRNIAIGLNTLFDNQTGSENVAIGISALQSNSVSNNVAIGNASLAKNTTGSNNLAIGSNALKQNTIGSNNLAIGYGSLISNTTGSENVAIGPYSLYSNITGSFNIGIGFGSLTSNTVGYANVAIGFNSLVSNTTGYENLAIGNFSLNQNTTGIRNLAIGLNALTSNTTGQNNAGIGYQSLYLNTIGVGNLGIGIQTLANNTTGNYNLAIGFTSLGMNTTGIVNLGIGYGSLTSNTTGTYNTAIGYSALSKNISGGFNVAIGPGSLISNTTGGYNTAIGYATLFNNTTGSRNIAIGIQALYSNNADSNLAIGMSSLQSNTTGINNIAIGDSALKLNTTGVQNLAIGKSSLSNNTVGVSNIAIGVEALLLNTTGINNLAIGLQALQRNQTGANNTAIGNLALYFNEANQNTAIGNNALYNNTTGYGNVAIGVSSMFSNTTGVGNLSIGDSALYANQTGSVNLAIGGMALTNNVSGNNNLAIGQWSLANNTSSFNVAIGFESLLSNTTGAQNTAIGYRAGRSITTGSRNVIIGSNSGSTIATSSNNIILSDGAGNIRAQYLSANSTWDLTGITDAWISYTPSWTASGSAPSLGNGTISGRYKVVGKTIFVSVKLVTGSTTTYGSGDWRFSLPVTAYSADSIQMSCSMLDNGINWYQGTVNGTYSGLTDRTSIICDTAGVNAAAVTATTPFTWGAGDSLIFNGSYEAA